jgi:predicted RNA-binding Zn-ribbon protein involved in translation (DUF1610 family)
LDEFEAAKGVAMPIIRASCPTCGDVDISPDAMTVMLCSSNGEASYVFRCPSCAMVVSKAVDKRIVEILVSSGVRIHFWRLPDESDEEKTGPPVDFDDLIQFHNQLSDPTWLERLIRYSQGKYE